MDKQTTSLPDTQQMIVFELDKEEFAVPIKEVREVIKVIEIAAVPQSPPFILGIINLRGKIVPVLDLEKKFNLVREVNTTAQHIMIAEGVNNTMLGILVDRVSEVLKVSPDSIKPTPQVINSKISPDFVKGVIVLEQPERLLVLLDLQKILTEQEVKILQPIETQPVITQPETAQLEIIPPSTVSV